MAGADLGIDLGTSSVLIYIRGKNIVLKEPNVAALDRDTGKIKAIGEEARLMIGRTPENIQAIRPLQQGAIANYTVSEQVIRYFVQKATGRRSFRKPVMTVSIPCGLSEVERRAVEDAVYAAGAKSVKLLESPIGAAIGAGIDINRPVGNMIVDIGAGITSIAIVSMARTVVSTSLKVAGNDFDDAITRYLRRKYNLLIGLRTAEDIKIRVGECFPFAQDQVMTVRGRNLVTGLPKSMELSSEELEFVLREPAMEIIDAIRSVLEKTPPELAADIADRGIVLTGGGSQLRGLEELIEEETKINTMTAEEPSACVAIGTGKYLDYMAGHNLED